MKLHLEVQRRRKVRYNFGTFEKAKISPVFRISGTRQAFSVFPRLLCKQGVTGSIPVTSTKFLNYLATKTS